MVPQWTDLGSVTSGCKNKAIGKAGGCNPLKAHTNLLLTFSQRSSLCLSAWTLYVRGQFQRPVGWWEWFVKSSGRIHFDTHWDQMHFVYTIALLQKPVSCPIWQKICILILQYCYMQYCLYFIYLIFFGLCLFSPIFQNTFCKIINIFSCP